VADGRETVNLQQAPSLIDWADSASEDIGKIASHHDHRRRQWGHGRAASGNRAVAAAARRWIQAPGTRPLIA
jgi:hypothetical protein